MERTPMTYIEASEWIQRFESFTYNDWTRVRKCAKDLNITGANVRTVAEVLLERKLAGVE